MDVEKCEADIQTVGSTDAHGSEESKIFDYEEDELQLCSIGDALRKPFIISEGRSLTLAQFVARIEEQFQMKVYLLLAHRRQNQQENYGLEVQMPVDLKLEDPFSGHGEDLVEDVARQVYVSCGGRERSMGNGYIRFEVCLVGSTLCRHVDYLYPVKTVNMPTQINVEKSEANVRMVHSRVLNGSGRSKVSNGYEEPKERVADFTIAEGRSLTLAEFVTRIEEHFRMGIEFLFVQSRPLSAGSSYTVCMDFVRPPDQQQDRFSSHGRELIEDAARQHYIATTGTNGHSFGGSGHLRFTVRFDGSPILRDVDYHFRE